MKNGLTKVTLFLMAILLMTGFACSPEAQSEPPVQIQSTQGPPAPTETAVQISSTREPAAQREIPAQIPATLEPAAQPETPEPDQPDMVEKQAPIEGVEINMAQGDPPRYNLIIISGLPGGCVQFGSYTVSRVGRVIEVQVTNLEPAAPMPCTTIYGIHEGQVDLGGSFTPGETYTVVVNGQTTNSFTARSPEGEMMAQKQLPIERTQVATSQTEPGEYTLQVISRLPLGSSCSQFNGYGVGRPAAEIIHVTVTHLEVTELRPCTADLPVVSTDIPLGGDFTPGQAYRVVVNGEVTDSFTARAPEQRSWNVKESPILGVELIILESFPPQYNMKVVTSLPKGSSCSRFNGYDVARPSSKKIEVVVTHFEVDTDDVPCTRDLPLVETDVSLGSKFESGEEYTVIINGQLTETFKAQ